MRYSTAPSESAALRFVVAAIKLEMGPPFPPQGAPNFRAAHASRPQIERLQSDDCRRTRLETAGLHVTTNFDVAESR